MSTLNWYDVDKNSFDWLSIMRDLPFFDLHIHMSGQQAIFRKNLNVRFIINRTLHADPLSFRASFPRLKDGNCKLLLSAQYVPEPGLEKDFPIIKIFRSLRPDLWQKLMIGSRFEATLRMMTDLEQAIAQTSGYGQAQLVKSMAELDAILKQPADERPIAVIHSVEGAHSLGGRNTSDEQVLKNLEKFFERGVACLTLAHFYPNRVVHPFFGFPTDFVPSHSIWKDSTKGLTNLGQQVVEAMVDLGMLIDLTHCTPTARLQIFDIVDATGKRAPLLATHVGANTINPTPYNLQDWEARQIAHSGGVVGVTFTKYWLSPAETRTALASIIQTIDHFVNIAGEDHVAIGSDFDGFYPPPDNPDNPSQLPYLVQALLTNGYELERIQKIMGGNALRVLREGWGKKV